jgi:hypothetical protein
MWVSLKNAGVFTGDCMLDQLIGSDPEKYEFCAKKLKKCCYVSSLRFKNVEIKGTVSRDFGFLFFS